MIAEASSHFFPSLPPEQLSPYLDHFHPATSNLRLGPGLAFRPDSRRRGSPFLAVNIVPHDQQVCLAHEDSCVLLLNSGAGETGHRQGQVGLVGLRSSPIICPEIDAVA